MNKIDCIFYYVVEEEGRHVVKKIRLHGMPSSVKEGDNLRLSPSVTKCSISFWEITRLWWEHCTTNQWNMCLMGEASDPPFKLKGE